jgi:uncharacterized lipoprotein YajG
MKKAKNKKRNWLFIALGLSLLAGCVQPGMTCDMCGDVLGEYRQ